MRDPDRFHLDTVSPFIGTNCVAQDKYEGISVLYARAIEMYESALDRDHLDVVTCLGNRANL